MSVDQLRLLMLQGRVYLVVGRDENEKIVAAMAYELKDYPNIRVGYVLSVGGKDVLSCTQGFEEFKAHLRSEGCVQIEAWCAPNTARLWQKIGFKPTYTVMRYEL